MVEIRYGCGCAITVHGSAIGAPKEKIRIEPIESPVPEKTPAPAPAETPEVKEPVGS